MNLKCQTNAPAAKNKLSLQTNCKRNVTVRIKKCTTHFKKSTMWLKKNTALATYIMEYVQNGIQVSET